MAAPVFDLVAEELERRTDLEKLEARGTVRIALREAGLDPRSVSPAKMAVVVQQLLPRELRSRGVDDGESMCRVMVSGLASVSTDAPEESPEAIFARLGGS